MYTGIKHGMSDELAGIYNMEINSTMKRIRETPGKITDKYDAMDKQHQEEMDAVEEEIRTGVKPKR